MCTECQIYRVYRLANLYFFCSPHALMQVSWCSGVGRLLTTELTAAYRGGHLVPRVRTQYGIPGKVWNSTLHFQGHE